MNVATSLVAIVHQQEGEVGRPYATGSRLPGETARGGPGDRGRIAGRTRGQDIHALGGLLVAVDAGDGLRLRVYLRRSSSV